MASTDDELRPLHILIPKALHARLKEMADARDRSVAAETRRSIESSLAEFDHEPLEPAGKAA